MTEPARQGGMQNTQVARSPAGGSGGANLADILERVLDKGIVIAGDIQINLLDIELLTIKLRLLVASVDKAKEMGIDWWEHDPTLSSRSIRSGQRDDEAVEADSTRLDQLQRENDQLHERLAALENNTEQTELPQKQSRTRSTQDTRSPQAKGRSNR